ncbi:hypothetical protein [Candidatus Villigracilis saccharophilus]|uniref:hypothetical protein n=1 Tax=Candidatus Villigracilis saccharophilus TaxID=3140684 RepID=UPI003136DC65|nr:hypothetical protein [Anaerolineales bacterium]
MKKLFLLFLLSSYISSCASATQIPQKEMITVYATSAAQPWLTELYTCADNSAVSLNLTADEPDITLRVGEPEIIISPVYQIDEEEILIVTNRESSVQNLTLSEAQELFAQGNDSAKVWVYASDANVQIAFDQLVMKGRSVTSFAGLATSPQQMSDLINVEKDAVGILPKHWMAGNVREVFSAGTVPVLAITKEEPQGVVKELIACLQK